MTPLRIAYAQGFPLHKGNPIGDGSSDFLTTDETKKACSPAECLAPIYLVVGEKNGSDNCYPCEEREHV